MIKLKRRQFLAATGLSAGGLMLGAGIFVNKHYFADPVAANTPEDALSLDLFVQIHPSGKIYIVCHRSEMGQGISSSLPRIIADEMEAAWEDVIVVQAPGHTAYGDQNTDGSQSVRLNYQRLRLVGARIKTLLEHTAAAHWQTSISECRAQQSRVTHNDGRSVSFGKLAAAASQQHLPEATQVQLKKREDFRYIGKKSATINGSDIVTGKAVYAWDLKLPGMEYACVARCPVIGGDVKRIINEAEIRAMPGVLDLVTIHAQPLPVNFHPLAGVAVIANSTWAAIKAKNKLDIEWKYSADAEENRQHDSRIYLQKLFASLEKITDPQAIAEETNIRMRGDTRAAFRQHDKQIQASYSVPYLSHAPMEPPCAVAQVEFSGTKIWACTQHPQSVQSEVAKALGIHPRMVEVQVTLLGGAFGRKSKSDFCVEAVLLSKARKGAPVKVCWTREDDIRHDYYHAISASEFRAALAEQNSETQIVALEAAAALPSIGSIWNQNAFGPSKGEMNGLALLPFDIPNIRIAAGKAKAHTRIGWLRSVINIEHAFGIGSFVDELALELGKLTPDLWLELIPEKHFLDFSNEGVDAFQNKGAEDEHPYDTERYRQVISTVAAGINQQTLQANQGWGFAAHFSFLSYAAVATKVTLENNKLQINEVVIGLDCGEIINPDRVRAQLEGSVVFGLSLALSGEITMHEGAVEQANFHDYPVLRMQQCPKITTLLFPNTRAPSGVGEPGVPPVAPSLCNAIVAAGGQRIRQLPVKRFYGV